MMLCVCVCVLSRFSHVRLLATLWTVLGILNKLTLQEKNHCERHHGTKNILKDKIIFCKKKQQQKLLNISYNFF